MKSIICIFLSLGLLASSLSAQSIKRQTLSSTGSSVTVGDFRVSSSFGQKSIACTVVQSPDGSLILRQGFQQPVFSNPCDFSVGAEWEEISTECGFYYSFEYIGDADIESATFLWDFGAAAFPATSEVINPTDIAYASAGNKNIRLTVEQDGCSDTFSFMLDVSTASFGANPLVTEPECSGDNTGVIVFDTFGGQTPFQYRWDDGSNEEERRELAPGEYAYTVTSADGCEVTGTVLINDPEDGVMLSGTLTADDCESILPDGSIDLMTEGGSDALNYLWSTGETTEDLDNLEPGTYTVTVFDNSCETVMLFEIPKCEDDMPTDVITPNGDGENDILIIPGLENFPNNELAIYNRWGSIVFDAQPYLNDWQGTNNKGAELVTGAYYYVVKLNDEEDTILSGAVTIVR